jgi:hypothetical protein
MGDGVEMILPCFSINHIVEISLASLEFSSQKRSERKIDKRQEGKRFAKARSSVRWHLFG